MDVLQGLLAVTSSPVCQTRLIDEAPLASVIFTNILHSSLQENVVTQINPSQHSPLPDGHLLGGHSVGYLLGGLCREQQISRVVAEPAEVLAVVRGQGLGLDELLGDGLGFGRCLRGCLGSGLRLGRCQQVRLRKSLGESLRFWCR